MYIKIIYSLFFSFILINSHAQELNCQVIINTSQIQGSANKQIFDQLVTVRGIAKYYGDE